MFPTKDQQIEELNRLCMAHVATIQRMEVQNLAITNNLRVDLKNTKDRLDKAIRFLENLAETHRYSGGGTIRAVIREIKER